jgi:iron-sulfur cluster assembly protein
MAWTRPVFGATVVRFPFDDLPLDNPMSIQLTPAALDRARRFLETRPGTAGLRLGVKKSGCSGFGYAMDLAERVEADDAVFEQEGVKVLVDPQSLAMVDGTTIDFVRRGLNQEFVFDNPKATGGCGCGESFTVTEGI